MVHVELARAALAPSDVVAAVVAQLMMAQCGVAQLRRRVWRRWRLWAQVAATPLQVAVETPLVMVYTVPTHTAMAQDVAAPPAVAVVAHVVAARAAGADGGAHTSSRHARRVCNCACLQTHGGAALLGWHPHTLPKPTRGPHPYCRLVERAAMPTTMRAARVAVAED